MAKKSRQKTQNNYYYYFLLLFLQITSPFMMRMARAENSPLCNDNGDDSFSKPCTGSLLPQWNWDKYNGPCAQLPADTFLGNRYHIAAQQEHSLFEYKCWQTPTGGTALGTNLTNPAVLPIIKSQNERRIRLDDRYKLFYSATFPNLFEQTDYGLIFFNKISHGEDRASFYRKVNVKPIRHSLGTFSNIFHVTQLFFHNRDLGLECGVSTTMNIMKIIAHNYKQGNVLNQLPIFLVIDYEFAKVNEKNVFKLASNNHNTLLLIQPSSRNAQQIVNFFDTLKIYSGRFEKSSTEGFDINKFISFLKQKESKSIYHCDTWLPNVGFEEHCTDGWYLNHPNQIKSIHLYNVNKIPYSKELIEAFFETYPQILGWLVKDGPVVKEIDTNSLRPKL